MEKEKQWVARGVARVFVILVMSVFSILILSQPILALDKLTGFVNDEAGVISQANVQLLNDELYNLKLNTSVEMAIATVNSLNGTPIEEYSLNLAHQTLGEKGKDNGVLILLAVEDRAYRIEVGYGLEPVLNAALLGRIGRNIMEPSFAKGDYEQGLIDGTDAIIAILMNDTSAETEASLQPSTISQIPFTLIFFVIIILFSVLPLIIRSWALKRKENIGKTVDSKNGSKKKDGFGDFLAAMVIANMFGRGRGGSGGLGGGSGGFGGGGFGGFGGGSFGGGGFSGKF